MNANTLNIKCEVNIDDIIAYFYYHSLYNPRSKRRLKILRFAFTAISFLVIVGGIILIGSTSVWEFDTVLGIILTCFGLAGLLSFILDYCDFLRRNITKKVRNLYGQGKNSGASFYKYSFSPEGIHYTTEFSKSDISWEIIEDIIQISKHIFVVVRPKSALIIPKRAFTDDSAFNKAAQEIKALFQASQAQQSS